LRRTISLIDTAAGGAGAGGVAWVNEFDQHTRKLSLVFDKLPELVERPGVVLPPLALANRDAVSYPLEVFKGDTSTAVFSLRNNTLGNHVIDMGSKASLLTRTLLKKSFRCLRIFGLKFTSQLGMALPQPIDLPPRVGFTIGVGGNVHYPQVNAKKLANFAGRRFFHLADLVKIKLTVTIYQVGLAITVLKQRELTFASNKGNRKPTSDCPDRDGLRAEFPGEDTLVVSNAAVSLEHSQGLPVELVAVSDFRKNSYHNLGSQLKSAADIVIKQVVKVILAKGLGLPGLFADVIGGTIHRLQGSKQRLVLFRRSLEFDLSNQLHTYIILYNQIFDKEVGAVSSAS